MTSEEFEKIKEAEKAHLRKLKQLKDSVRVLERQKKVSGAVTDMTSSIEEKMDEHRQAIERVALDAARAEARLEMAIEAADEDAERRSREVEDEQALQEHRAKELIRQMKSVGAEERKRSASDGGRDDTRGESSEESSDDRPPIPDKTIGRMKP